MQCFPAIIASMITVEEHHFQMYDVIAYLLPRFSNPDHQPLRNRRDADLAAYICISNHFMAKIVSSCALCADCLSVT